MRGRGVLELPINGDQSRVGSRQSRRYHRVLQQAVCPERQAVHVAVTKRRRRRSRRRKFGRRAHDKIAKDDDDDNNDVKNDVDAETTKSSRDDDDCHSKHAEPISSSLRFGSVAQIPHTGGERNRRRRERVRLANASGDERKSLRTLKQQGRRPRR